MAHLESASDRLISRPEACKLLGITHTTLRKNEASGELPVVTLPSGGKRVRFSDVQRIIQGQVSHDA